MAVFLICELYLLTIDYQHKRLFLCMSSHCDGVWGSGLMIHILFNLHTRLSDYVYILAAIVWCQLDWSMHRAQNKSGRSGQGTQPIAIHFTY
jgi:hypothetical protein